MATHAAPEIRRAQILVAAQTCFGTAGYHKTKMDDIVRVSGLSKGALYWYFKSKDEIFLALFDQIEKEIFSAWDDVSDGNSLETLRVESEVVLESLLSDRSLVETWTEFLKHPLARGRFAKIYDQSRSRLQETIEAGIACGEIEDCDAQHAAAMLTAMIEGLLLQALADPKFDAIAAWPTTWKIISRGLMSTGLHADAGSVPSISI